MRANVARAVERAKSAGGSAMQKLLSACVVALASLSARAQFTTPPSSADLLDVLQGTAVTGSTPGIAPAPGACIGLNSGGPEPGTCFCPDVGVGNFSYVEVATTASVALSSARLYGKNDGSAAAFRRGMGGFRLLADTDGNGSFETTAIDVTINPDYDNEPANVAVQSEYLELPLTFPAVSAAKWRMEFVQGTQIGAFEGVRVIEFDAFGSACAAATTYCTSSSTTNGCHPAMSASGTPSATATSGYTLTCTSVEGQKSGLIFYGISGPNSVPWATGSSSFLCVKTPTQRTTTQSSGGTLSACNGQLSIDFLGFMAANPSALGHPLTAGQQFNAQAWFRDPPAPKTTNLSNGLQFTLCP
jgi:hypothetical protein